MNSKVFKALSLLFEYPTQELLEHLEELKGITTASLDLNGCPTQLLDEFYLHLEKTNLYKLEEEYVAIIDRGRGTSLYLFEHVHGDSKERGQAMVDLLQMYEKEGYHIVTNDLPDYLPVFLEFLSSLEWPDSIRLLREVSHLIENIQQNLAKLGSHYYALCSVLLSFINVPYQIKGFSVYDAVEEDFDALDKEWQDAPVEFGNNSALHNGQTKEQPIHFYSHKE